MLVKQEHQAGALPKLVGDRSLDNELLALGNKACREIGAIHWARSRHDLRPFEQISFVSIPMSLQVTTKPASANPGVNCETEHLAAQLPIGSGEIESAHRYVIQERLKLPGAWWQKTTAQQMLALRTCRANQEWEG